MPTRGKMGIKLSIDSSEINKEIKRIAGFKLRAEDITAAAPAIRLMMQEDVDTRFANAPSVETGGEVLGGVQWRSLSESYLVQNPRRYGGQILRDTGELQQSLTVEGHPYEVFNATESEIVFGTALTKASRLQRDRPFIFWHPILLEKIANYLVNWVSGE